MTRQRLMLKSILFLLLVILVYLKVTTPDPNGLFEIATDLGIALIVLGVGEIILRLVYLSLSSFFVRTENIKTKNYE